MAQIWNGHCNTKAYGLDTSGGNNLETIEYKSGRVVTHLRNSKGKKEHSIRFKFDDSRKPEALIDGRTEYQWFIYWLDETLKGASLSFLFIDLIGRKSQKEYRLKEYPTFTGQRWKYASCTFVEV